MGPWGVQSNVGGATFHSVSDVAFQLPGKLTACSVFRVPIVTRTGRDSGKQAEQVEMGSVARPSAFWSSKSAAQGILGRGSAQLTVCKASRMRGPMVVLSSIVSRCVQGSQVT